MKTCCICDTGWETGLMRFVGCAEDGRELWCHGGDCAYALEKVTEFFSDGEWMTLEEYAALSAAQRGE